MATAKKAKEEEPVKKETLSETWFRMLRKDHNWKYVVGMAAMWLIEYVVYGR